MTPEAALESQIERYRQMTGEERLMIGLRLTAAARAAALHHVRSKYPGISEEEAERLVRAQIRLAYQRGEDPF